MFLPWIHALAKVGLQMLSGVLKALLYFTYFWSLMNFYTADPVWRAEKKALSSQWAQIRF